MNKYKILLYINIIKILLYNIIKFKNKILYNNIIKFKNKILYIIKYNI